MCADDVSLDRASALKRAADRLGLTLDERFMAVDCTRLEAEIRQYQIVFRPAQNEALQQLRREALKAMVFLDAFSPRLVGSVLSGTADHDSKITLHLFADTPEAVMTFLMEKNIPFAESERRYHYRSGRQTRTLVLSFVAFDVPFDLVVFDRAAIKEAPLTSARGGPVPRASRTKLKALLDASVERV
jgi:hypothetical protein